ncbi:SRPBCC family protein [Nitratireductor sp. L1-7-SE]|uniref:SRPBCC family protein n=1 Tax=Nitratireductor rhodophyticola TaxID=2854036 RepID=A0ABS7R6Q6_9HYPH|nr:SRPBCC family protein [Nitratireductor rhodophyticola]MBY8916622.1 SRPBCC family protein [Nitratireductor rhodophyticola]MBY8921986.1 SRPBCC family protein [Nitratireductor rhodophyticola]
MRQIEESDYGVATAPNEVRFERSLPGPVERVWAYLTEADKRRQWLAGGEMEPRAGGSAKLLFRHSEFTDEDPPEVYREMNEKGFLSEGRIIAWDPPRHLAMTWPGDGADSQVEFELFPEGDRVLLVVTHKRLADRDEMINVSGGWHAHLAVLEAVLSGEKAPPFWSQIKALEAAYTARFNER